MKRFIENYRDEVYDLVVVGGGITGAAVAYDAASRGLSVALVEKQDFGCATSAATSKLIHGGFRYIANMEFGIVRESLRERRILSNIAPNLVYPVRVLVPCYRTGITRHTTIFRLGMFLYDMLSFDKGRTWDASKSIGLHRVLSAEEALKLEPAIPGDGLKKVFSYYDCASLFPERLTLSFIKSAVSHGAVVSNYCNVEGFLYSGGGKKISGVLVRDTERGGTVEIKSRLVVNCGGPWADLILDIARGKSEGKRIRRSEGIHIITKRIVNESMLAMVTSSAGGGFVVEPWRGHTLIGPTDKEYTGNPDEYRVTKQAVMELLESVNSVLKESDRIRYEDVVHTYGGLRPLVDDKSKSVRESSRRYEIHDNAEDGFEGLITIEGGKYTTSRNLAQHAMEMVFRKLDAEQKKCVTATRHLAGCEIQNMDGFIKERKAENKDFDGKTVESLARYYGTECRAVLDIARLDRALAEPLNGDGEIAAQAVYAAREEMALTLKDILVRRTGIGTLGDPGDAVMSKIAAAAAVELKWDEERKSREIREARTLFAMPE